MLSRLSAAKESLAAIVRDYPEAGPYTRPASAGDVRELAAKLDEITELLRHLVNLAERR